jgi:cation/acetate symporter
MVLIGSFYIMTTFLGFGAATIVGPDFIKTLAARNECAAACASSGRKRLLRIYFSHRICDDLSGGCWTHDQRPRLFSRLLTNVLHHGVERARRGSAGSDFGFCSRRGGTVIAILLGPTANVAFLVALAFAVAASANPPVIVLSIFWRRFNTAEQSPIGCGPACLIDYRGESEPHGGRCAHRDGAARHLIRQAWFPLENPGILVFR